MIAEICENFEFGAVQKCANLITVDLKKYVQHEYFFAKHPLRYSRGRALRSSLPSTPSFDFELRSMVRRAEVPRPPEEVGAGRRHDGGEGRDPMFHSNSK